MMWCALCASSCRHLRDDSWQLHRLFVCCPLQSMGRLLLQLHSPLWVSELLPPITGSTGFAQGMSTDWRGSGIGQPCGLVNEGQYQ
eukprot:scaffold94055_cov26-Tisochrysis_lutea.AAC.2